MNVLTTTDVPLDTLAAEIRARIEAGDRAADKAADHFRAAGLRLLDARAFSDRNESVGIPKTARVRFKLDAGEGGQHA